MGLVDRVHRMKATGSFGRMGRLLPFLSVLYIAVFPHSVHSYILHDHAHSQHDHQTALHQEQLSLREEAGNELPETDSSESGYHQTASHEDCSFLCDFMLPISKNCAHSIALISTKTWCVVRAWTHILTTDPPPPRVQP